MPEAAVKPALPEIKKTLPCLRCGANTDQKLLPTATGAAWLCTSCGADMPAFTHDQMREIVMRGLFKIPENIPPIDTVPDDMRVFLEYYGDVPEGMPREKEASVESILEHAQLTGCWPEVGKPLFAMPGARKLLKKTAGRYRPLAIPYGKVVRVEGVPPAQPTSGGVV